MAPSHSSRLMLPSYPELSVQQYLSRRLWSFDFVRLLDPKYFFFRLGGISMQIEAPPLPSPLPPIKNVLCVSTWCQTLLGIDRRDHPNSMNPVF